MTSKKLPKSHVSNAVCSMQDMKNLLTTNHSVGDIHEQWTSFEKR